MAKKKEVIITCNATNVKAVIEGLERGMAALAREEENLLNVIKQRGYAENDEKKRLKELERAMDAMRTNIQKNRDEQKKLGEVLKDLSGAKLKDLKKALQEGKAALNNMSERDPKRKQLVDDLKRIQRQIDKNTGSVSRFGSTHNAVWQTAIRNITAYMGVFAAFNFVRNKMSEMIKKNYELSDAIMNVRKVSGLAIEEVNQLYQNISKIDTRNTVNTLMDLAYQGGKLGIGNYGVEGLTGFVKAAEQVQMALGEDLGEEALPALAKLTENMGLIKEMGVEQAMQKTASAMFMLSTTSVSTGQGIVDFSKRLMPVAKAAGVTTDQLLGLASATESSGLAAEVSATAFVKMFPSIYKNSEALETYLGLQKGFIRESYDQGKAMEAMVAIFDKMNQMGNINKYPELFKLLGSEGARMNTVMTAMANNVDMLRDHLSTSSIAFKEGTAVINEYMLQNASAAGILERANNIWEKAFVNPEGVDMVKKLAEKWYDLSKEVTTSETWMASLQWNLKAIATLVGILIKLLPTLLKAMMFYGVATTIRKIYVEFTMLNTAMSGAANAAGKLSAFLKSNIWVLAGTAIMFAASAIIDMASASSKAKKEADEMGDALKNASNEGEKASARERGELKKLYEATQDQKKAIEERTKAALELKRKYPSYFSDLTTEQILAGKAAEAYQNLAQQILNAAKARAMEKKIEELQTENIELEDDNRKREQWRDENEKKYEQEKAKVDRAVNQQNRMDVAGASAVGGKMGYVHASNAGDKQLIGEYQANDKAISDNSDKIKENTATMERLSEEVSKIKPTTTTSPEMPTFTPGPVGDNDKGGSNNGLTKAEQEAKQAMRKEMEDAQKESTGVLSKLEEWYRLQEAAITEARADGKMTEEQAKQMVNTLNIIKNESLATARRAITTGSTEAWDELKKNVMPKAMADASDLSKNLLETIQNVPVKVLHDNLAKFNGDSEKVFGLDSRAFFDQINAKAAGNTREAARLRAKLFKQTEILLEQYEVVRVAQKKMQTDMEGIGIVTETYEEFANRMQEGITEKQPKLLKNGKTITDAEAYGQMGAKFIGQGTIPYRINIENADEALQWIQEFATNAKGELEDWAQAFPDIENWVTLLQRKNELQEKGEELTEAEVEELSKIPEMLAEAIPTIKAMFYQLETSANQVAETIKKQVEEMTNRNPIGIFEMGQQHEARMRLTSELYDEKISSALEGGDENAAIELEERKKQALIDLEYQYQQELWQIRDKMGTTIFEQYENEVAMYKNMLDKKLINEKQFQQKKGQLQMKLGLNVAQQYNDMMSDMVNALQEAEIASVEAKYDAEINAAKANGQDTTALEEQKEAEIMEIRKKYAGMQFAVKISEIIANTAVAIMQAYAQLGPIGGSIAAAMLTVTGAAQLALAKAEYDKVMGLQVGGSKSTSSSSNTKTRIVSGMLTYDKGNVQRFVGQDGKIYTAIAEPTPKDGLVKHPIATTVQGQPALVAENGPEIVIGRETTRAIMMNEPELIRYLANYQLHGGSNYRAYDSGNVTALPTDASQNNDISNNATLVALTQVVAQLSSTVQQLQKNGIPAHINKYGAGGLIDEVKSGLKFDKRYNG